MVPPECILLIEVERELSMLRVRAQIRTGFERFVLLRTRNPQFKDGVRVALKEEGNSVRRELHFWVRTAVPKRDSSQTRNAGKEQIVCQSAGKTRSSLEGDATYPSALNEHLGG